MIVLGTLPPDVQTAINAVVLVVLALWLLSSLSKGEIRFKNANTTKRDEDPLAFWLGCGLIFLLFIAVALAMAGVIPRSFST